MREIIDTRFAAEVLESCVAHRLARTALSATDRQAPFLKRCDDLPCNAQSATVALADQAGCHDVRDEGVCSLALCELALNKVSAGLAGDHRTTAPGIM
ncbi:hypothetical protein ACKWRH_07350 [Bradyrhizobium sp. Pa8]|uniref:hypothetical protein n=1 Tax=Bradyrhizobium sp. Pa8 TaxID=3386552 RepID=UPI00403F02ED